MVIIAKNTFDIDVTVTKLVSYVIFNNISQFVCIYFAFFKRYLNNCSMFYFHPFNTPFSCVYISIAILVQNKI